MIVFASVHWKMLRAGSKVERSWQVRPRKDDPRAVEPCPYREGNTYLARPEGARQARMHVIASSVEMRKVPGGHDWHAIFQKVAEPPQERLLASGSQHGYTDDPARALGNSGNERRGTDLDPGAAPPENPDDDKQLIRLIERRQAAIDHMRDAFHGDPVISRHLSEIERRARQLAA